MRTSKQYNLVIGTDSTGAIYILNETFVYADDFHGATGTIVRPVTQEEIDDALTTDQKEEFYEEVWRMDAASPNGTTDSLADWLENIDDEEYIDSRFECQNELTTEEIADALGEPAPARYAVTGVGRIWPAPEGFTPLDSDEVREALAAIDHFEN